MNALFSLEGKNALVVGATEAVGRRAVSVLNEHGASVVGTARRQERIDRVVDEENGRVHGIILDVRDAQSVREGIERAIERVGAIDILINGASSVRPQRFVDIVESTWQYVIETNLTGNFRVAQAVAESMIESGTKGSIINISSILATKIKNYQASFSASKAAMEQLTRNMAYELAGDGIRVNSIAPGYFETEVNLEYSQSNEGELFIKNLIPRRLGEFPELDGAILLLASNAGSYISGITLTVDGGTRLG